MSVKTFQHGGDIDNFALKHNISKENIFDLSSNINFVKPKSLISFKEVDIAPYPSYHKLYEIISKKYSVKASRIELFNGGSSAIFSLFSHLQLKECFIYSPAYLEYKKAASLFCKKTHIIDRFKTVDHSVKKGSLVIFVNPSTPDGKYYDLDKLMKTWIKKECTILIDESFLDFCGYESAVKYLNRYDKLYILKSLTKFYACAGVRAGILLSKAKNIKALEESQPLWKISVLDMHYLIQTLQNKSFESKSSKKNATNKKRLYKLLIKQAFIKTVYPSDANFFLVKLKNIKAKALQKILAKHGIMIRDCSNFDGLDSSYVRIAVKSKKNIDALSLAFKDV